MLVLIVLICVFKWICLLDCLLSVNYVVWWLMLMFIELFFMFLMLVV